MKRLNKINVLDTDYSIFYRTEEEDPSLIDCLGYCDKYQKIIVINDSSKDEAKEMDKEGKTDQWSKSYEFLQKKVLRHELTHAFVTECGLSECSSTQWVNNEEAIDFMAINGQKLVELFKRAGAL